MMKTHAKLPKISDGGTGMCRKLRSLIAQQVTAFGIICHVLSDAVQTKLTGTAKLIVRMHANINILTGHSRPLGNTNSVVHRFYSKYWYSVGLIIRLV